MYTVVSGDTCATICSVFDLSAADFLRMNPSVGAACMNLQNGQEYCVQRGSETTKAKRMMKRTMELAGVKTLSCTSTPTLKMPRAPARAPNRGSLEEHPRVTLLATFQFRHLRLWSLHFQSTPSSVSLVLDDPLSTATSANSSDGFGMDRIAASVASQTPRIVKITMEEDY
ncbi:hypothetical protein B0H17DRAFT_1216430 [Mycena rosella]|uniref:LysM domain-containing protein n=1 Tax=Mycena rosella TaxID=1033263 RepID=A0AAD7FTW4_MYCRO|nr:hypothetical protein B0H17DRAFT_1216430 [Mycena rosella]